MAALWPRSPLELREVYCNIDVNRSHIDAGEQGDDENAMKNNLPCGKKEQPPLVVKRSQQVRDDIRLGKVHRFPQSWKLHEFPLAKVEVLRTRADLLASLRSFDNILVGENLRGYSPDKLAAASEEEQQVRENVQTPEHEQRHGVKDSGPGANGN
eukprot:g20214.t1